MIVAIPTLKVIKNMKVKAITFDLDDTLWPLFDVIMHAHKSSNDYLIEKHPQMQGILFSSQERISCF